MIEENYKEVTKVFDTGYCKTKKQAVSKIDFNEINEILTENNEEIDVKEELDNLLEYIDLVRLPNAEVNNDIIKIYKNKEKGWRIRIKI